MAFHLAAYSGTIAVPGVRQLVPPVVDMYLPSSATGFVLPTAMKVVAAYATSPGLSTGAGLQNARINAPSLLRVSYPYIRPVSNNLGESQGNPNVMDLIAAPLSLPASETVSIEVVGGIVGQPPARSPVLALLWFCDALSPVPPGEMFVLRCSATGLPATRANVWSAIGPVSFDQSIPAGAYAVIGFEHWSPTAIAARLSFPGMYLRPGTLSSASPPSLLNQGFNAGIRSERLFYEGGIGVYGSFQSFAPPSLEVLTTNGDTTFEAYLTVIRTGEMGFALLNQEPRYVGPLQTAGVQHDGPLTAAPPRSPS